MNGQSLERVVADHTTQQQSGLTVDRAVRTAPTDYGQHFSYEAARQQLNIPVFFLTVLIRTRVLEVVGKRQVSAESVRQHAALMAEHGYVSVLMSRVVREERISLNLLEKFRRYNRNQFLAYGLIENIARGGNGPFFIYPLAKEQELVQAFVLRGKYFEQPDVISADTDGGYGVQRFIKEFGLSLYQYKVLVSSGIIERDRGFVSEESLSRLRRAMEGKVFLPVNSIAEENGVAPTIVSLRVRRLISSGLVELIGREGKGKCFYVCRAEDEQAVILALITSLHGPPNGKQSSSAAAGEPTPSSIDGKVMAAEQSPVTLVNAQLIAADVQPLPEYVP